MIAGLPVGNPDDEDEDDDSSVEYPRITVTVDLTIDPNKYMTKDVQTKGGPEEFARSLVTAILRDEDMSADEFAEEWKITRIGPWTGIPE